MIQSHELPERMVEINGVRKYRVNVKEVVREDTTSYTYDEVEFNANVPVEISDKKVAKIEAEIAEAEAKIAKQLALDNITVEVNGNVFDGRAKDQVNIMAAIQAAEVLGETSTEWVLNDNSKAVVAVDELKMVLALSIQKVGQIVKGEV